MGTAKAKEKIIQQILSNYPAASLIEVDKAIK
jgi:hypothetical protein